MKAIVEEKEILLEKRDGKWFPIGGMEITMENLGEDKLLIVAGGKPHTAKLLGFDKANKTMEIMVNGVKYPVQMKEPLDDLLHSMGLDTAVDAGITSVKAPMPGLVLAVEVAPGAEVKKGDKLLVLEAMKMENVIKASGDGTVAKILIEKGQTVDKNQILIEFS